MKTAQDNTPNFKGMCPKCEQPFKHADPTKMVVSWCFGSRHGIVKIQCPLCEGHYPSPTLEHEKLKQFLKAGAKEKVWRMPELSIRPKIAAPLTEYEISVFCNFLEIDEVVGYAVSNL